MLGSVSAQNSVISPVGRSHPGDFDEQQASSAHETSAVTSRSQFSENKTENTTGPKNDSVQISAEAREIVALETRDREVKAHEAAHAAVGGAFAGAPTLTYTKGPNGQAYATGGEVSIDINPVAGDPLATLQKAQIVRSAALAPAQPSAQDLRVASRAAAMAVEARAELVTEVTPEKGALLDAEKTEPVEPNSDIVHPR